MSETTMQFEFDPQEDGEDSGQDSAQHEVALTRVLVVSANPGTAEMVARSVAQDTSLSVQSMQVSLHGLLDATEVEVADFDLIMFEIRSGDDTDLSALRALRGKGKDTLKFLGITQDALSMTLARTLMDAGVDEVMPLDIGRPHLRDAADLAEAEDIARQTRGGTVHNGMIVAVAQSRGGIGATTFSLNLATLLTERHKRDTSDAVRVAVVDLDFQNGVLGASIDVEDTGGYVEFLKTKGLADADRVTKMMVPYKDRFDVLAAPMEMAPLDAMTPEMMATLLDELRLAYDYVILDLPRAMAHWFAPIMARADQLFLLSDLSVHSVRQMRRMIDTFTEDQVSLPVEVLVSKDKKPFRLPEAAREAETFLSRKLTTWIPSDDRAASRAADAGEPVALNGARSVMVKAIKPLIDDLRDRAATQQRRQA